MILEAGFVITACQCEQCGNDILDTSLSPITTGSCVLAKSYGIVL